MGAEKNHEERVRQELKAAGVTRYGMAKFESRTLHESIALDEHIHGVVYGRYGGGSAMMVATNKRVLFIDKKPFVSITDTLHYSAISGVEFDTAAGFAHVVVQSIIGNYMIRFANISCAKIFTEYVRQHQSSDVSVVKAKARKIFKSKFGTSAVLSSAHKTKSRDLTNSPLDNEAYEFLSAHELGVLATINRTNSLHAAAVYYVISYDGIIHIVTRAESNKAKDILSQYLVALAVYDEQSLETAQLEAMAEIETDAKTVSRVFETITRERKYETGIKKPPVTATKHQGEYIVIRLTPVLAKYTKF